MNHDHDLVSVTTVFDSFHGQLVVARLATEGITAALGGASDGPYPFNRPIPVLVSPADAERARGVLLADEIDAAFDPSRTTPMIRKVRNSTLRAKFARLFKRRGAR